MCPNMLVNTISYFKILTHLVYRDNAKKRDVSALKARGRRALAYVICYCKMTSVMALDGVTSFFSLERRNLYN